MAIEDFITDKILRIVKWYVIVFSMTLLVILFALIFKECNCGCKCDWKQHLHEKRFIFSILAILFLGTGAWGFFSQGSLQKWSETPLHEKINKAGLFICYIVGIACIVQLI